MKRLHSLAVTIVSRSTLMSADAIVIGTTWYKLWKGRVDFVLGRNTLSSILLVDGETCTFAPWLQQF